MTTSTLIDRAERYGWITRRVDDGDTRRNLVSLTEHGQDVLERILDLVLRDMGMPEETMLREALREEYAGVPVLPRMMPVWPLP